MVDLVGFICKETEKSIGFVTESLADSNGIRMLYIPRSKFERTEEKDMARSKNIQTSEGERVGTPVWVRGVDETWLQRVAG
jgi:hypothetical protein